VRRIAAREKEIVTAVAVAVAGTASELLERRVDALLERAPVGRRRIGGRIEIGVARRVARRAAVARDVDWRRTAVVRRRAVGDPLPQRVEAARSRVEDRAARVLDVTRDVDLRAVVDLNLHRERLEVLCEQRRLAVWAVVEQEIATVADPLVCREVEVPERVPLRVGDVAARAGVRADAAGREDRRDRPIEVRRRRRLLRLAPRRRQPRDEDAGERGDNG